MMADAKQAGQRDLAITVFALLVLIAWDFCGLDLPLARLFGSADGFHWREAWLTSRVLHEGGRSLAWLLLGWQLLYALVVKPTALTPPQQERRYWLICLVRQLVVDHDVVVIVPGLTVA